MCIHTSRIDIAMQILQRIVYPQFSFAQFVVDKKSFLDSLGVNTFSAVKICQFLHLVKEVSGAYNIPIVFLFGLWGSFKTAPQSFNHAFTSFGTITPKAASLARTDYHSAKPGGQCRSCSLSPTAQPAWLSMSAASMAAPCFTQSQLVSLVQPHTKTRSKRAVQP
jgi:hypothetical protein